MNVSDIIDELCCKNKNYKFEYTISMLFQKKMSLTEIDDIFSKEKRKMVLMMFENYPYYLQKKVNVSKVKIARELLKNYCLCDKLENSCFKTQNWKLLDYCAYLSCWNTNVKLANDNISYQKLEKGLGNIYSSLINKHSQKKNL